MSYFFSDTKNKIKMIFPYVVDIKKNEGVFLILKIKLKNDFFSYVVDIK